MSAPEMFFGGPGPASSFSPSQHAIFAGAVNVLKKFFPHGFLLACLVRRTDGSIEHQCAASLDADEFSHIQELIELARRGRAGS